MREAQGRADLLLQKAQVRLEEVERDINELRLRRRGVEGSLEASIQALYHALEFIRDQDRPDDKVLLHRPTVSICSTKKKKKRKNALLFPDRDFSHLGLDYLNVYGIRLYLPFFRCLSCGSISSTSSTSRSGSTPSVCTLGPCSAAWSIARLAPARTPAAAWPSPACVLMPPTSSAAPDCTPALSNPPGPPLCQRGAPGDRRPAQCRQPLAVDGLIETQTAWHVVPVNLLLRDFDPDAGRILYKPDTSRVRTAVRTETARVFLDFSRCPLWRVTPVTNPDGASLVRIYDLRFGLPEEGAFSTEYLVDASGKVLRERFSFGTMKSE